MNQCSNCGAPIKPGATRCLKCGTTLEVVAPQANRLQGQIDPPVRSVEQYQYQQAAGAAKSKVAYVLLGVFLGALGIHNFYAGYNGRGIIQLLISVCTCGYGAIISGIWAIIEICTVNVDAQGRPFV